MLNFAWAQRRCASAVISMPNNGAAGACYCSSPRRVVDRVGSEERPRNEVQHLPIKPGAPPHEFTRTYLKPRHAMCRRANESSTKPSQRGVQVRMPNMRSGDGEGEARRTEISKTLRSHQIHCSAPRLKRSTQAQTQRHRDTDIKTDLTTWATTRKSHACAAPPAQL